MADKTLRIFDSASNTYIPLRLKDNGDGSHALAAGLPTLLSGEDQANNVLAVAMKLAVGSQYAPTLYTNFGAATKAVIKATPGQVFSVRVSNADAAARYLLLHNKATAPVAADVPLYALYIAPSSEITIGADFFTANGAYFSTGIGFSISTTGASFTDSATAGEHMTAVHYA